MKSELDRGSAPGGMGASPAPGKGRGKTGRRVWLPCLLALILAAALICLYHWQRPTIHTGEKTIRISVIYKDGSKERYTVKTKAKYLKAAAQSVLNVRGKETAYGFSVLSINGEKASVKAGGAYWAIYVNGKYGRHGVDTQPVNDGDKFLFKYETD